jgi:hypothetical protein
MDVFWNRRYLGRFQTRDINIDGAFIETGTTVFSPRAMVEVAIGTPGIYGDVSRTKALVIRYTDDGVGLWFTNCEPDFCQRLSDMLGQLRMQTTLPETGSR